MSVEAKTEAKTKRLCAGNWKELPLGLGIDDFITLGRRSRLPVILTQVSLVILDEFFFGGRSKYLQTQDVWKPRVGRNRFWNKKNWRWRI